MRARCFPAMASAPAIQKNLSFAIIMKPLECSTGETRPGIRWIAITKCFFVIAQINVMAAKLSLIFNIRNPVITNSLGSIVISLVENPMIREPFDLSCGLYFQHSANEKP